MSLIEQLKAEARALREAEKTAGRDLKHCDALEQVAKKHGFASWRACVATPDRSAPAPKPVEDQAAAALPSALRIVPSRLANGDFESARQSAFTRWMAPGLQQAAIDFSRNIGLLPIYSETSRDGARYLFWHLPAGATCEVRSGRKKEPFLQFDRANREHGRCLVSLHTSVDGLYSAVWISTGHQSAAVEFLSRFGIAPAEIQPPA
jgi:hypothetical protein